MVRIPTRSFACSRSDGSSRGWRSNIDELLPNLRGDLLLSQVPALASGDRGMLDLLTLDREGRLAVIELKADEDFASTDAGPRLLDPGPRTESGPPISRRQLQALVGIRAARIFRRCRSFPSPTASFARRPRIENSIPPMNRFCAICHLKLNGS